MEITVGRIVHYTLSTGDADQINRRALPQLGNTVTEGQVVPLLVVRVWSPTCINGQALLDGNDALWVTSVMEGTGPRTWAWPPRT